MPLLKRKAFEKSTASGYLRDDDEVFHCEITDEIFKDYEEYCERIILVNSMVWSCEMTGKNNLTYAEALETEKNARRMLKDVPAELRAAILYLANMTRRCSFAEMYEDVFCFVRDRYFIGETLEACINDLWYEANILTVHVKPPPNITNTYLIPSSAYTYDVLKITEDTEDGVSETVTVPHDQIRRKKGVFSREKCKLFLKQFVQQGPNGIITIKESGIEKYNIDKMKFSQLFTGTQPDFPSSKKLLKVSPVKPVKKLSPDKKQPSITKFTTKQEKFTPTDKKAKPSESKAKQSEPSIPLKEQMRRAAEELRQKQLEDRLRKNERKVKLAAYVREWNRLKDDLDLEDHKVLPKGTQVEIEGLPSKYIGDFLSVLEFIHLYGDILKTKDVFHYVVDVELLRKAFTSKEHAGLFSDLIQMMLTTIFSLQEDEAEEYNEGKSIQESIDNTEFNEEIGMTKAVELATKASKWPQTYLGTPLSKLPLDAHTVTEVLRLHALSSGAAANERCARWRYQQRGGYSSLDDSGISLRIQKPHVIRALARYHVADLPLADKFSVLQCLMNQILSYATVRDIVEEKIETLRTTKYELKMLHISERKRETELTNNKIKVKKEFAVKKAEAKPGPEELAKMEKQLQEELDKLDKENEQKRGEFEKKSRDLQSKLDLSSYLGSDRAYQRYWLNQAVAGLFVEADIIELPCRDKVVPPLSAVSNGDIQTHLRKMFEQEQVASNKENHSNSNNPDTPKKLNGIAQHRTNGADVSEDSVKELLMCTANPNTCLVHGNNDGKPKWFVYHTAEQIDNLITNLNKRGIRESDLKQNIEVDKDRIVKYIEKCPIHMLSSQFPQPSQVGRGRKFQPSLVVPADSTPTHALELALRDYILELEEKVYHGCLGAINVKDREAWRGTIMLGGYDKQAEYLTWGHKKQYRDDGQQTNGIADQHVMVNGDDEPMDLKEDVKRVTVNKYRDPGYYLGDSQCTPDIVHNGGSHLDDVNFINGLGLTRRDPDDDIKNKDIKSARDLASALLQISQCINRKYLKRPLGYDEKERKDRDIKNKPVEFNALERWETSLMESQSFSQVALHLMTLDSSVSWSMSILNASCRLCRRRTDAENMLLCDGCNKGHHLYCLKPKLTKVPTGDWFCDLCKPKEKTPRKQRKLFKQNDSDFEDDALCRECGSGGRLEASCTMCEQLAHAECARVDRNSIRHYVCRVCKRPEPRRCATEAVDNIRQYARALTATYNYTDSESSDDNITLTKVKSRRKRVSKDIFSKEPSPVVTTTTNNSRVSNGGYSTRHSNGTSGSRSRRSKETTPVREVVVNGQDSNKRRSNKRSSRNVQLHIDLIQHLLTSVFKHKDSWPFTEPVSIELVPDYLDIIETPMDFTTMRQKLESGSYTTDEQFIADAALVFQNCYTYNQNQSSFAKCGIRLEKYFNKRCTELGLPTLPNTSLEAEDTIEEEEIEQPKTKRSRNSK